MAEIDDRRRRLVARLGRHATHPFLDTLGDAARGIVGSRGDLPDLDATPVFVEQTDVGERPARIHADTPSRHPGAPRFTRQFSFASGRSASKISAQEQVSQIFSLGETLFLLVRFGYDAVCIDRSAGPLPIRSFTGDIGGRVPLGLGQGATAILAFLRADEQDEVIRHNLPRLRETSGADEASLRAELAGVTRTGYCDGAKGLIPGMTGLAVPILDQDGCAVAALSVGSTIDRLTGERSAVIASLLKREAAAISARLNPFDPVLRRPAAAMENLASP
jgi:DNA-binding IclR family transcriptional regulator